MTVGLFWPCINPNTTIERDSVSNVAAPKYSLPAFHVRRFCFCTSEYESCCFADVIRFREQVVCSCSIHSIAHLF